jgi:hypothetical protein
MGAGGLQGLHRRAAPPHRRQAFRAAPSCTTTTGKQDKDFGVLELIMTAPVVVASWISLQYYGSTVAPDAFGAGNKLLHNVTGGIGVVEGNGGTLRAGLPWQSVHDGEGYAHDPLRLSVCIEAPREAMTEILKRHDGVRALFDNRWLHLFALDAEGRMAWRYNGDLTWVENARRRNFGASAQGSGPKNLAGRDRPRWPEDHPVAGFVVEIPERDPLVGAKAARRCRPRSVRNRHAPRCRSASRARGSRRPGCCAHPAPGRAAGRIPARPRRSRNRRKGPGSRRCRPQPRCPSPGRGGPEARRGHASRRGSAG